MHLPHYLTSAALAFLLIAQVASRAQAQVPSLIAMWGYPQVNGVDFAPAGVAVDASRLVYVLDASANSKVRVFSPAGIQVREWGSFGEGLGQFEWPVDIALDHLGNVFVKDGFQARRMEKFTSTGTLLTTWICTGSGICVDAADNVWVADGDIVKKYSGSGTPLATYDIGASGADGVAVSRTGEFYVALRDAGVIRKFSPAGTLLRSWDVTASWPVRLAIDSKGFVYVVEYSACQVEMFDPNGAFITKWGTQGRFAGQFLSPIGIAIDDANDVYIADHSNSRIQVFGPTALTPASTLSWGQLKHLYQPRPLSHSAGR
jgi:DNA-binding beta-propeller fold protein YncE